jgi:hypothetical protein
MKTRFFPSELTEIISVPEYGIEVRYCFHPYPKAMMFTGKKEKRDWYFRYRSQEEMMKKINDYITVYKNRVDQKRKEAEKSKAEQVDFKASEHFKVGDIIVNTWGWEQTNVDFYQVTEVLNKKIRVAEIHKNYDETGFMSGSSMPCKDEFKEGGDKYLLSLKLRNGEARICDPESYYYFHVWSGQEQYESHYA